jgi:mannosyl-oligosaccharide alpha-1,2-mannosidase
MEGLLGLTRKTSSNFYYVCEKNGDSLSEKVKSLLVTGCLGCS